MIYLDYNATTPIDPRVAEAMRPFLDSHFGNPSSGHALGKQARAAVDNAREQVAACIGAKPEEIYFTGGGSESNNLALKGSIAASEYTKPHLITSVFEHPAISEVCDYLETKNDVDVTRVEVDKHGIVDIVQIEQAITANTVVISVMHANNEIGSVQPIDDIAKIARECDVLLHSDAAQSIGKIEVDVNKLDVDMLTIAGHKLYTHKGIGALYVRTGVTLEKQIHGASHERNLRAGTENVLQIVGLGKACELIRLGQNEEEQRLGILRDTLWRLLKQNIDGIKRNGHPEDILPNTLSIILPGITAESMFAMLPNIAASAGAACHSGETAMSDTLKAIGLTPDEASGTVRFSIGRMTTEDEVSQAASEIIKAWER
ncbi:MAG: cysteine desulfurase family protein [Calditrichia bacterium]